MATDEILDKCRALVKALSQDGRQNEIRSILYTFDAPHVQAVYDRNPDDVALLYVKLSALPIKPQLIREAPPAVKLNNAFDIGAIVYPLIDPNQYPRIITALVIRAGDRVSYKASDTAGEMEYEEYELRLKKTWKIHENK